LAKTGKFGDLRRRLVFLVLALVVYRIGAHIPVPASTRISCSSCSRVSRAAS
jgi:preprotein translocase subunit SecY